MADDDEVKRAENLLRRGESLPDQLSKRLEIRITPERYWQVIPSDLPQRWSRDVVVSGVRSTALLDARRREKKRKYEALRNSPAYRGPRIVAEGDSWFEHPLSADMVVNLGDKYAVLSLAKAGDTWDEIYIDNELFKTVEAEQAHIVMLSAGGNAVLTDFNEYVRLPADGDLERPGTDFLLPNFEKDAIEHNITFYELTIRRILDLGADVILHGYDYPDPRSLQDGGQFIGARLEPLVHGGVGLWRKIVNTMLDAFNSEMKKLKNIDRARVHFIDLRRTIGTSDYLRGPDSLFWFDEIHPSTFGVDRIVPKFSETIDRIWSARAGA